MNKRVWKLRGMIGLLMLLLLGSCSQEDDIDGIFRSGTWYLSSLYASDGRPSLTQEQQNTVVEVGKNAFYIQFLDGTFSGKTQTKEFSGKWSVNAKSRTLELQFTSTGSPTDAISKSMIELLKNAGSYKGDSNFLEIHETGTTRYVGLTRVKKE